MMRCNPLLCICLQVVRKDVPYVLAYVCAHRAFADEACVRNDFALRYADTHMHTDVSEHGRCR